MNELLIPFALVNNKVKKVSNIYKQDEIFCLECGEKLILRNGDVNIKHLAHQANSNCIYKNEKEYKKRGGGESYEHKYAKEFIKDNLTYFRQYGNQIIIKDGEFKLGGYSDLKINRIDVEYMGLKNELNLDVNYVPDLLLRTNKGLILLEIYKTNKKIPFNLENIFKGKDIYIYEIDITKIKDLNIKDIFRNMKLLFSDLKIEFDKTIKPIQNNIIENLNLKNNILENNKEINNLTKEIYALESKILDLENENFNLKQKASKQNNTRYYNQDFLKNKIEKYKEKDIENRKLYSKCVRDWYSNKLNLIIDRDIKKTEKDSEEYNVLIAFKRFYNGKVGSYSSYGGDNRLKEIAKITRGYSDAIKYLGMDNNRFKELVFMNIDKGEELLKTLIHEDILEII